MIYMLYMHPLDLLRAIPTRVKPVVEDLKADLDPDFSMQMAKEGRTQAASTRPSVAHTPRSSGSFSTE
jgi:hypothetical protein